MELVDSIGTRYTAGHQPDAAEGTIRQSEGEHTVWRVPCGDLISRGRCIAVYVDSGDVVLACPPGETARLSTDQISQLQTALSEAAALAERHR